jgi:hypothetical protein
MKQLNKLTLVALSFGISAAALSLLPSRSAGAAGSEPVTVTGKQLVSPSLARLDVSHDTSPPLRDLVSGSMPSGVGAQPALSVLPSAADADPTDPGPSLTLVRSFAGIATPQSFPLNSPFATDSSGEKMLSGQAAQSTVFTIDNGGFRAGMLPADRDGKTPPPAGSPNYLMRTLDLNLGWPLSSLQVWTFQVDWRNP